MSETAKTSSAHDPMLSRRRLLGASGKTGVSLIGGAAAVGALAVTSDAAIAEAPSSFPDGITVNDGATKPAAHQMELITRLHSGISWPVAVFQPGPSVNRKAQATLDIMPSGSEWNLSNPADNGITWVDCCDANVQPISGGRVGTARVACFSDHIELRSTNYGGAEQKGVWIVSGMGSTPNIYIHPNGSVATNSLVPQTDTAWTVFPGYSTWTPLVVAGAPGQSADLFAAHLAVNGTRAFSISPTGIPHWGNGNGQVSVGAAGGAAALPATPSRFLTVIGDDGNEYVVPAYALQ